MKNFYYSDTDSIYIDSEELENLKEYIDEKKLGFMKNDYGKDKYIIKAIFFDVKRTLFLFNDYSYKLKFLGVNFKNFKK